MLWYASYGSNLAPERFACYIDGGRAPGASRACPGARDSTPPVDERAVTLPGRMFFGWHSPTWHGGVSFLDAHAEDEAYARAYLITESQFADVAAQEMHRQPGEDLDLAHVMEHGKHSLGAGRYETLHLVGELDGHPMLTFTARHPGELKRNAPSAAYLSTVAGGLRQTHDLSPRDAADYLLTRPGMDAWSHAGMADLLTAA